MASENIKLKKLIEVGSLNALFTNVSSGIGCAFFFKSFVDFYKCNAAIYSYPIPESYNSLILSLVYRKNMYISSKRDFINLFPTIKAN